VNISNKKCIAFTFIISLSLCSLRTYIYLIYVFEKTDGAWVRDNGMRVLIQSAAVDLNPPSSSSSSSDQQESVVQYRSSRRSDTVSRTEFEAMAKRALHAESKIEVCVVVVVVVAVAVCLFLGSEPAHFFSPCQTLIFERLMLYKYKGIGIGSLHVEHLSQ
jgi:hypothetical protein